MRKLISNTILLVIFFFTISNVTAQPGKVSFISDYYLTSSGFNLSSREVLYTNALFLYHDFRYGINNHLSVGTGTIPLFIFYKVKNPTPVWFGMKASTALWQLLQLSAELKYIWISGGNEKNILLSGGGFTLGNHRYHFSGNVYYAFNPDFNTHWFFSAGARAWLKGKTFLIAEYMYFPQNYISTERIISLGIQIHYSKMALDLGLINFMKKTRSTDVILPYRGFFGPYVGLKWQILKGK